MADLFFGTPTELKGITPSYLRELDRDMPILHLSSTLAARNLDPHSEVDNMKSAVTALELAADEFQKEVQAQASGRLLSTNDMETTNMLLKMMEPLQRSRQAILEKLELLAGDEQICSDTELMQRVADLRTEMLSACAGISLASWRKVGQ